MGWGDQLNASPWAHLSTGAWHRSGLWKMHARSLPHDVHVSLTALRPMINRPSSPSQPMIIHPPCFHSRKPNPSPPSPLHVTAPKPPTTNSHHHHQWYIPFPHHNITNTQSMADTNGSAPAAAADAADSQQPSSSTAAATTATAAADDPSKQAGTDAPPAGTRKPRDARIIHLILASMGVSSYQERVPLMLMDFAYRTPPSPLSLSSYSTQKERKDADASTQATPPRYSKTRSSSRTQSTAPATRAGRTRRRR